jgi:hypothetical protein
LKVFVPETGQSKLLTIVVTELDARKIVFLYKDLSTIRSWNVLFPEKLAIGFAPPNNLTCP